MFRLTSWLRGQVQSEGVWAGGSVSQKANRTVAAPRVHSVHPKATNFPSTALQPPRLHHVCTFADKSTKIFCWGNGKVFVHQHHCQDDDWGGINKRPRVARLITILCRSITFSRGRGLLLTERIFWTLLRRLCVPKGHLSFSRPISQISAGDQVKYAVKTSLTTTNPPQTCLTTVEE